MRARNALAKPCRRTMRMRVTDPHIQRADRRLAGMAVRLFAGFVFAFTFLCLKLASEAGASLIDIMFWRQFVSVILVGGWAWSGPGWAVLATRRPGAHARRGLFGMTGMIANFGGLTLLPLAEATTISFTAPVFATILAALFLKENVGRHRWTAVVLGFIGVLVVMKPGSMPIRLDGAALALASAFMVALISVQIRDLGRTESAQQITFWFATTCSVVLLPVMLWQAHAYSAHVWLLLAAVGIGGTAGQLAISTSLRFAPVSVVMPMDYAALMWAILFGWLAWDVIPTATTWIGAPVIIVSGLYIAWREHQRSVARAGEPLA